MGGSPARMQRAPGVTNATAGTTETPPPASAHPPEEPGTGPATSTSTTTGLQPVEATMACSGGEPPGWPQRTGGAGAWVERARPLLAQGLAPASPILVLRPGQLGVVCRGQQMQHALHLARPTARMLPGAPPRRARSDVTHAAPAHRRRGRAAQWRLRLPRAPGSGRRRVERAAR